MVNELSAIIRHNRVRYSEPAYDVLPYKVLDVLGSYGGQGLDLYPFREVIHSDQQVFRFAFA